MGWKNSILNERSQYKGLTHPKIKDYIICKMGQMRRLDHKLLVCQEKVPGKYSDWFNNKSC